MTQRFNTGNPRSSNDMRDLNDNAIAYDEFFNGERETTLNRFNEPIPTLKGALKAIDDTIRESGFTPLDSFEKGANITLVSQALRWELNNSFCSWRGQLPKFVPFGSTPETTGGFGQNAWVDVSDLTFRTQVGAEDGGRFIAECSSFNALRQITGLKHGDRIFLQGVNEWSPGQGAGEFVADKNDTSTVDNNGTVAVTIDDVRLKRKLDGNTVTPEMFSAVRGQPASYAIQAALNAGYDVNGMWGKYICDNIINVPNNRSLISCEFDLLDMPYPDGAISSGNFCTVNVIVNGTSRSFLPSSQIAWRSALEAEGSNINIRANGVNTAAFFNKTKHHTFSVQANNIIGELDKSEGYGALLANGCVGNKGTVEGSNIARHGLYISSGSSGNKIGVNLSRCLYKAAVNINSRPNQFIAENNEISGYITDSYTGVNFYVENLEGIPNTGGAISNNRLVNLTIVGAAGISQNAILMEAASVCETAFGNGWRNVLITGAFESTTMPVVSIVNMPNLDTDGLKIRGTMNYRALSIGKANTASMGTMRLLNVDILTDSAVIGVYNNVDTGLLDFTGVSVVTGGSPYQFSGSTINNVVGGGKEELQTVSSNVPANSSVVVPVVFRRQYYSARAICSISSASFSSENANVNYFAMTSSGCSVRLINTSTNAQTLSATIRISGL